MFDDFDISPRFTKELDDLRAMKEAQPCTQ
jgi:hypothetical protein